MPPDKAVALVDIEGLICAIHLQRRAAELLEEIIESWHETLKMREEMGVTLDEEEIN
jgi:hypothetical protein